jgi:uncharacterized RDD family membrane protein YckC
MDHILDAPAGRKANRNYAGFWIRVGASVVDAIVLIIVQLPIMYTMYDGWLSASADGFYNIISSILGVVYYAGMESSSTQATLGKMAVRIKVGDEQGNRISFPNALGRYLAKIISAILLLIGFMMVGWDNKKQGLHDKIAGTYVFEV